MMRMMWVGVLSVLALTGCSSEASNSSSEASAPATSATSSATAGATAPASSVPARPSTAADAPTLATPPRSPEPLPEDARADLPPIGTPRGSPEPMPPKTNVALPPEGTDMPHGEALYLDICQRFLPAIDALESTGAASREQSVVGMRGKMESNPSWSTVSVEDQQEIVRGLTAAGNGSC